MDHELDFNESRLVLSRFGIHQLLIKVHHALDLRGSYFDPDRPVKVCDPLLIRIAP